MTARIHAQGVTLDVPLYQQPARQAGGWGALFFGAAFDPPRRRLARLLEDIDFELRAGDRLAILGRNGAGKSTLLRVLNRVYQPTRGTLTVEGSCMALLNMGLGFNNEATVLENIYLRGVAMGLGVPFLRTQIPAILEFSGLAEKSGHRLRTLSSGQRMRLGFAISTSVQHDIILMDEWVGAGDAEFMAKATKRMQDRVGGSKIVVLASHSTGLLRDICNKGVVLERGRVVEFGDITTALKSYHDLLSRVRDEGEAIDAMQPVGAGGGVQVFGCLEQVTEAGSGRYLLTGWLVDNEGGLPGVVALEVGGTRVIADRLQRISRKDVANHFGLANDQCGFRAEVVIGADAWAQRSGSGLAAYGGTTAESANAPLRLAPALLAHLRDGLPEDA